MSWLLSHFFFGTSLPQKPLPQYTGMSAAVMLQSMAGTRVYECCQWLGCTARTSYIRDATREHCCCPKRFGGSQKLCVCVALSRCLVYYLSPCKELPHMCNCSNSDPHFKPLGLCFHFPSAFAPLLGAISLKRSIHKSDLKSLKWLKNAYKDSRCKLEVRRDGPKIELTTDKC